jgi:hypothetical protein
MRLDYHQTLNAMAENERIAQALKAHQYQFDGSHGNRNECALCAMTAVLQRAALQNGAGLDLTAAELGHFLDRIPFRHLRFPAWFPGPGGATHPRAARSGLNAYLRHLQHIGHPLPWQAVLRSNQSGEELASALQAGELVMIYGVGRSGIPHVVLPLAHQPGSWTVLDPGYPVEKNPRPWSEAELDQWWLNFGWIYPKGTLVSLVPNW